MERFLNLVEEHLSAGGIDEIKLKKFLEKVNVCDYARLKVEYQNLSKEEHAYSDMLILFGQEGKFCSFVAWKSLL